MDVYGENKGIIDEVMGSADEDTKNLCIYNLLNLEQD